MGKDKQDTGLLGQYFDFEFALYTPYAGQLRGCCQVRDDEFTIIPHQSDFNIRLFEDSNGGLPVSCHGLEDMRPEERDNLFNFTKELCKRLKSFYRGNYQDYATVIHSAEDRRRRLELVISKVYPCPTTITKERSGL